MQDPQARLTPRSGSIAYNQEGRLGLLTVQLFGEELWRGTDLLDPSRPWRGHPRVVLENFSDLFSLAESCRGATIRQETWAMERLHSVHELRQIWEIWQPVRKLLGKFRFEA